VLRFDLARATPVALRIYDVAGRQVATLVDEPRAAGAHAVRWDGRGASGAEMASGIYFCRLEAGPAVETRKMSLVR
jgi:flagellar hook assembly protein FlgD